MFGRDEKVSQVRLTAVQYIVLGIFMILAYGLWRLQVVQSDMYASLAEKNRVRNVPILAPRGKGDLAAMYRAFRGRDPVADPLLIERGLKPQQ